MEDVGELQVLFFFKQKTAYEMRISDWSSDVCSSDLGPAGSGLDGLNEDEVRGIATEISGAGDADTLGDATAYTDGREDAIRDDMATGAPHTLNPANEYTDTSLQQLIDFAASQLEVRPPVLAAPLHDLHRPLHHPHPP